MGPNKNSHKKDVFCSHGRDVVPDPAGGVLPALLLLQHCADQCSDSILKVFVLLLLVILEFSLEFVSVLSGKDVLAGQKADLVGVNVVVRQVPQELVEDVVHAGLDDLQIDD